MANNVLSVSLILLLASLTVGGITVWWSGFYAESENISISLETVSKTPSDQLQMTGARYSGVSASGLKFNIEADKVIERQIRQVWCIYSNLTAGSNQTLMARQHCFQKKPFITLRPQFWI